MQAQCVSTHEQDPASFHSVGFLGSEDRGIAGVEVSWKSLDTRGSRYRLTEKIQKTPGTHGLGVIGLVSEEQLCPNSELP